MGISSPGYALDVKEIGTDNIILNLRGRPSDNQAYIRFASNDNATANALIGIPAANTLNIFTDNTERLRITSAGLVGVGTSSPTAKTEIAYTSTNPSLSTNTGAGLALAGGSTVQLNFGTNPASPYNAWIQTRDTGTNSAWPIALNPLGGNVGIGTSSPNELLHVNNGNIRIDGNGPQDYITFLNTSAGGRQWTLLNAGASNVHSVSAGTFYVRDSTAGANRIAIDSSGNVGIGSTTPGSTGIDTGATQLFVVAPNSNFGTAATFVADSSGRGIVISDQAKANTLGLSISSSLAAIGTYASNIPLAFATGAAERARIDTSGRLLVGTSTARSNVYHLTSAFTSPVQIDSNANNYSTGLNILNYSSNGYAPLVTLGVSLSSTKGTNTLVRSNDELGFINFVGNDGTNFIPAALIGAYVDGTPGTNDMPGRLVFSTTADGVNFPTERMRITSAGLVGIGVSAPIDVIHAKGNSTYAGIIIDNSSATGGSAFCAYRNGAQKAVFSTDSWLTGTVNDNAAIYSADGIKFYTNNYSVAKAVFTSGGALGIGTMSPAEALTVVGNINLGVLNTSTARTISTPNCTTTASAALTIQAGQAESNSGLNASGGAITLAAGNVNKTSAANGEGGSATVRAGDVVNGGITSSDGAGGGGSLTLRAGNNPCSGASSSSAGDVFINGGNLALTGGSNGNSGSITLEAGTVTTNGNSWGGSYGIIKFNVASSERARIDSSGNVGIGTTSPGEKLTVRDSNDCYISAIKSFQNKTSIGSENSLGLLASDSSLSIRAGGQTSASERARIDTSGRLLVGTSSAAGVDNVTLPAILVSSASSSAGGRGIQCVHYGGTTDSASAFIGLRRSRGTVADNYTSVQNGDALGAHLFYGSDGSGWVLAASIAAYVDSTTGTNDMPGRLTFSTTADGASSPTERMRIGSDGTILFVKTSANFAVAGVDILSDGGLRVTRSASTIAINRLSSDGNLIEFYQDGTIEGTISVSGTTVSYNGAHLSRWSQLPSGTERTEILRGSVLSNLDEMCEWDEEDNEQLNRMKVSDVEGDKNVSGVFQAWDDDDDTYTNDFYCAMTGDFMIRIAGGVTVERGDLLMSAGDGTAKPQNDDIIRSKTVAKVTSTNVSCTYEDGSYCVPCVLMAC
jgi:hypothetical protein